MCYVRKCHVQNSDKVLTVFPFNFYLHSYTFYLELVATEFEERTQNALNHLKEQSQFVRILGSYPKSSQLIGHMKNFLDALSQIPIESELPVTQSAITLLKKDPLKIGIIGFGTFGQFLAKTFVKNNDVYCINKEDCSSIAKEIGCEFFQSFDIASFSEIDFDVILLSVSIISFEEVLRSLPKNMLRGKLIVDVLSVKVNVF